MVLRGADVRFPLIQLVNEWDNSLLVQATEKWQCEFSQANNMSLSKSWASGQSFFNYNCAKKATMAITSIQKQVHCVGIHCIKCDYPPFQLNLWKKTKTFWKLVHIEHFIHKRSVNHKSKKSHNNFLHIVPFKLTLPISLGFEKKSS